ncbi:transglutaminase domain-containing protein [Corallincola holothuriorum]|uniref:Transglutaminase domain-containing protein n=1 Tax=Corallincola holothuriorum TaxID=2282215 RepID=A0A368NNV6_9GAMM|nr:transglutaminase domain-containing protein [Corallincola holothuriorum]RCU51553.1 transglutaminase domain-containing protein [Corallincola holothuriorum]
MKDYWPLLALLLICCGIVWWQPNGATSLDSHFARQLGQQMELAVSTIPPDLLDSRRQRGEVQVLSNGRRIYEDDISAQMRQAGNSAEATYLWRFEADGYSTATAQGLDNRHHFVNSYLVGYAPFVTDKLWVPLYTVASRKTYQLDSQQYRKQDLWQNSAQSYLYTRGDCEDHALLLADWLIESGIDARVVMGKYRNEGHAWVVAFNEGEAFLLEATDKRKHAAWRHYPKAILANHYAPDLMFNRHTLWINQGATTTRDYDGTHWQKRSLFKRHSG